jgi:hypothetical protein
MSSEEIPVCPLSERGSHVQAQEELLPFPIYTNLPLLIWFLSDAMAVSHVLGALRMMSIAFMDTSNPAACR